MSEEKMKLCLTTTVINNPEIQKFHGHKLKITEGELLELKFRPDKKADVQLDEEGMDLLHYNQSYSAAARFMTTLDEALDKLINGTGVVGR